MTPEEIATIHETTTNALAGIIKSLERSVVALEHLKEEVTAINLLLAGMKGKP
jgi:hypothetical protein